MRRAEERDKSRIQPFAVKPKSLVGGRIPNRHTPELKIRVTHSKQTTANESNRHNIEGSPNQILCEIFFALSSPSLHSAIIHDSDSPSCLAL
jgi:hypothetical protein